MGIVADAFVMLEAERLEPQYEVVRYKISFFARRKRVEREVVECLPGQRAQQELRGLASVFGVSVRTDFMVNHKKTHGFRCVNPLTNQCFGYYLRKKSSRKELK